jgi:hypothetical protein
MEVVVLVQMGLLLVQVVVVLCVLFGGMVALFLQRILPLAKTKCRFLFKFLESHDAHQTNQRNPDSLFNLATAP